MALTGLRVAEFDRFFAEHVESGRRPAPTRLELSLSAGAETTARELAARESSCCSFFVFTFDGDAIMRIEVPARSGRGAGRPGRARRSRHRVALRQVTSSRTGTTANVDT
ncbi:hypothetical protein ACIO52_31750 [Nocardia sp. NPDC087230]|uniref:hypothetical protein n=1 Tax=Nocardia sp. NPDC087230 TaxID=3364331 RepID=UPI003814DF21